MATRFVNSITPPTGFGLYDSELNTGYFSLHDNFNLTITLKVFLRPKNEGRKIIRDADRNRFRIDNWPAGEWNTFRNIYQTTGQSFWDNKFWLKTPDDFIDLDRDIGDFRQEQIFITLTEQVERCVVGGFWCSTDTQTYREAVTIRRGLLRRPNLNCRFRLELADSASVAHKTIDVYYITHRRSGGQWIRTRPGRLTEFRSDDSTYSSSDLMLEEMEFEGHRLTFQTHIHEIGHALGLDHSGVPRHEPQCIQAIDTSADSSNDAVCYGTTLESAGNVMGMGMNLSWHDSLPWRYAAELHTGVNQHRWEIYQRPLRSRSVEFHAL